MPAFVRLAFFPGASQEHFEALAGALRAAPQPSERLLFAAGPVDGGWQVVQVWTSREGLTAFNEAHFLPALVTLGPRAFPAAPVVTDFEPVQFGGRALDGAGGADDARRRPGQASAGDNRMDTELMQ